MSLRDIARTLGRSVGAVERFLNNLNRNSRRRALVTGQKITVRQGKALIRKAYSGEYSARDMKKKMHLPIAIRRVQQILSSTPHLKYKKMFHALLMTLRHRKTA